MKLDTAAVKWTEQSFVVLLLMNRVSDINHIEFILMKGLYKHLSYKISTKVT